MVAFKPTDHAMSATPTKEVLFMGAARTSIGKKESA